MEFDQILWNRNVVNYRKNTYYIIGMLSIEMALAEFKGSQNKAVVNFQNYVQKHRQRIPDYGLYQDLGICIGSGSVESKIKQIGARIKITGAQWKAENVSQILKLRCAYLNQAIA